MDDIVVLILTLIFIIAGIFGQMKKRREVPVEKNENQPEEDNFWEVSDEILEEPRKNYELQKEARKIRSEETNREKKSYIRQIEGFEYDLTKEKKISTGKKKKFPLKKAVIYSEILHRKYV